MEQTSLKNRREAEAPGPWGTPRPPPQTLRSSNSDEHGSTRSELAQTSAVWGPLPTSSQEQPLGLPLSSL